LAASLLRCGVMGGSASAGNRVLLHPECHDRVHDQLDLSVASARYLTANGADESVFPSPAREFSGHAPFITGVQPAHSRYRDDLALPHDPPWLWRILA
jgi:hypothetical protein